MRLNEFYSPEQDQSAKFKKSDTRKQPSDIGAIKQVAQDERA